MAASGLVLAPEWTIEELFAPRPIRIFVPSNYGALQVYDELLEATLRRFSEKLRAQIFESVPLTQYLNSLGPPA